MSKSTYFAFHHLLAKPRTGDREISNTTSNTRNRRKRKKLSVITVVKQGKY